MHRIAAFVFLAILSWTLPSFGKDVSGRWRLLRHTDDGNTLETFLEIKQQGSHISGTLLVAWGNLLISDGRLQDHDISFTVSIAPTYAFRFAGKVDGNEMQLIQYDPNVGSFPVSGIRMKENESTSPARLPLPDLRELPDNGLARTPPMGWNSWNFFHDKIDDSTVRQIADAMVASGMRAAGYVYLNIDDTWQGQRDTAGLIQPNKKFPNMKALADYVHSKGLKLGIYSSPGPRTCGSYEGSYGHEEQDANTFAEWGIDYLKYDWCSAFRIYQDSEMRAVYQKMGDALIRTRRPIVYSLCQYGKEDVWRWGKLVSGNLWRTTGDIRDNAASMFSNAEAELELAPWAEPGHWNDPDMLEVGNGSMSAEEYRTHLTLWSVLAAPLIAGNDIRNMTAETRETLTNSEVIAVDQDRLGKQGRRVLKRGDIEIWTRPLAGDAVAIALINMGSDDTSLSLEWKQLGIDDVAVARDLWKHQDLPQKASRYAGTIVGHGCVLIRVQRQHGSSS